jgi:hypothetical protein
MTGKRKYRYEIDGKIYSQGGNTRRSSLHSLVLWLQETGRKPAGDYTIAPPDAEPLVNGVITWADGSTSRFTVEADPAQAP